MVAKHIEPKLGAESFTCPHCRAIAHQTWFRLFLSKCEKESNPFILDSDAVSMIERDSSLDPDTKKKTIDWIKKVQASAPFIDVDEDSSYLRARIDNVFASRCYSCDAFSLWISDKVVYPVVHFTIEPNADLPEEIRIDFLEAASIADSSPRGAAALLRLCIQKLLKHLGENGPNINADIASLVRKGLDPRVQKALDIVRVIGNEAVHPGQVDLRDDKATAVKLFGLVNLIADQMITQPRHLEAMFEGLPEGSKRAIEKRDSSGG